ncbi:MAG: ATP-binding cassette domain-containing protein, partial [Solirubrobacterales bacterium]|nr:ATP-binding cassette domain-containing protein [Solirubrobacterales bacterium]
TIRFDGQELRGRAAHETVGSGLVLVPEGRQLFPFLTVRENLQLGAHHRAARRVRAATLAEVLDLFPVLAQRCDQLAGQLSGGEQQMCALARGLMAKPRLLMLDEPSLGLAPIVIESVFALIRTLRDQGLTMLLVEQNVGEALEMSSRGYVLEQGRVTMTAPADELLANERLQAAYLGA